MLPLPLLQLPFPCRLPSSSEFLFGLQPPFFQSSDLLLVLGPSFFEELSFVGYGFSLGEG
jgi:hypothetical protein